MDELELGDVDYSMMATTTMTAMMMTKKMRKTKKIRRMRMKVSTMF